MNQPYVGSYPIGRKRIYFFPVIIHKKVDIIGTVCMNMVICDITGVRDVADGDEAVFLGTQGEEGITGDDIAGWSDTISYEIFLSIGQSSIREYIE